jgi:hypothetical protein
LTNRGDPSRRVWSGFGHRFADCVLGIRTTGSTLTALGHRCSCRQATRNGGLSRRANHETGRAAWRWLLSPGSYPTITSLGMTTSRSDPSIVIRICPLSPRRKRGLFFSCNGRSRSTEFHRAAGPLNSSRLTGQLEACKVNGNGGAFPVYGSRKLEKSQRGKL